MAQIVFLMSFYTESPDSPKENIWVCDHLAIMNFSLGEKTYL